MGLFDFATDLFTGNWTGLAGDIVGGLSDSGPSYVTPSSLMPVYNYDPLPDPMPQPVANRLPVPSTGSLPARARAAGLPAWSARFPSLWQFIATKGLGTGAIAQLLTQLNKWGPTVLSTVIGAGVVADLINYKISRKRRRMNPANTKALRRSLRRLKSFDRLAHRVSRQLHRGGRRGGTSARRTIVTGNRSVVAD